MPFPWNDRHKETVFLLFDTNFLEYLAGYDLENPFG